MGELTCAFTGHRAEKLPWGYNECDIRCQQLKHKLYDSVEAVYDSGFRRFICGMAEGCDLYFCEAVLLLKEAHADVKLEAAVPFSGQADRWPAALKLRYDSLIRRCDTVNILQTHYSAGCMMRRNQYMVDNSDLLIACYDGKSGGTLNTIRYAIRKDLQILHLPLDDI